MQEPPQPLATTVHTTTKNTQTTGRVHQSAPKSCPHMPQTQDEQTSPLRTQVQNGLHAILAILTNCPNGQDQDFFPHPSPCEFYNTRYRSWLRQRPRCASTIPTQNKSHVPAPKLLANYKRPQDKSNFPLRKNISNAMHRLQSQPHWP